MKNEKYIPKKMKGTKQFVDYADNLVIKRLGFGVKTTWNGISAHPIYYVTLDKLIISKKYHHKVKYL